MELKRKRYSSSHIQLHVCLEGITRDSNYNENIHAFTFISITAFDRDHCWCDLFESIYQLMIVITFLFASSQLINMQWIIFFRHVPYACNFPGLKNKHRKTIHEITKSFQVVIVCGRSKTTTFIVRINLDAKSETSVYTCCATRPNSPKIVVHTLKWHFDSNLKYDFRLPVEFRCTSSILWTFKCTVRIFTHNV